MCRWCHHTFKNREFRAVCIYEQAAPAERTWRLISTRVSAHLPVETDGLVSYLSPSAAQRVELQRLPVSLRRPTGDFDPGGGGTGDVDSAGSAVGVEVLHLSDELCRCCNALHLPGRSYRQHLCAGSLDLTGLTANCLFFESFLFFIILLIFILTLVHSVYLFCVYRQCRSP